MSSLSVSPVFYMGLMFMTRERSLRFVTFLGLLLTLPYLALLSLPIVPPSSHFAKVFDARSSTIGCSSPSTFGRIEWLRKPILRSFLLVMGGLLISSGLKHLVGHQRDESIAFTV